MGEGEKQERDKHHTNLVLMGHKGKEASLKLYAYPLFYRVSVFQNNFASRKTLAHLYFVAFKS